MGRPAVIVASDLLLRTRLQGLARAAGVETETHAGFPPPPDQPPTVLVVDLDLPGALDGVAAWRDAWPGLRIVGFLSHVEAERRRAAGALGCEVRPRSASARADESLFAPAPD